MKLLNNKYSRLMLLLLPCFGALSHQTNTTHPRLTDEAVRLIQSDDLVSQHYMELYRFVRLKRAAVPNLNNIRSNGPLFTGNLLRFDLPGALDDARDERYPAFMHGENDVMLGDQWGQSH